MGHPGVWGRGWVGGCGLLEGGEAQGGVVVDEDEAESFYDEVMVFALGETGDGDGADDAGVFYVDGEGSSVGGVFGFGEGVFFGEGGVVVLEV